MPPLKCLFVDWHGTFSTSLFWDYFRKWDVDKKVDGYHEGEIENFQSLLRDNRQRTYYREEDYNDPS